MGGAVELEGPALWDRRHNVRVKSDSGPSLIFMVNLSCFLKVAVGVGGCPMATEI